MEPAKERGGARARREQRCAGSPSDPSPAPQSCPYRKRRRARYAPLTLAAALAFLLASATPLLAERTQRHDLIVAINGDVSPDRLPRDHPAPVALQISGRIATADGSPLPRLSRLRLQIAGRGLLDTAGLPRCRRTRLANADSGAALRRCRAALVGHGKIAAQVFLPHQRPFALRSRLLAFNGATTAGKPAIWVHAFSRNPPLAIVLPFIIAQHGARLGTVLNATVPPALGDLPHLARFQLTIGRRFRHHGASHSYLSASCPAPAGFSGGFLTIAKAAYVFADGRRPRVGAVRGCRAR